MEIIKYEDRTTHPAHDNAQVDEYIMHNKNMDICVVNVNGRTPLNGCMMNKEYSCVCLCISGVGSVCGKDIKQYDAFNIPAGTEYWFDGDFKFIMCGTPAYNPAQNIVITSAIKDNKR
ncbi:hypothetical protein HDR60_04210 [bacterium]|nr:hypothetical protein [bacterium]